MFAPSEPTRFGSAMKIHKCIFAALTSLTFHVEQFSICRYKKESAEVGTLSLFKNIRE